MKRELRRELIESKLTRIEESSQFIKDNLPDSLDEFRKNKLVRNALYKEAEYAIQMVIDVASIINTDLLLGMPESEDEIFSILEKKKVIQTDSLASLKELKGFRNILVHKYGEVDDEKAFVNIKEGLKDFDKFIEEIRKFVKDFNSS